MNTLFAIFDGIEDTVNNFIQTYLQMGIDWFVTYLPWWAKVLILVAVVVILVLGIIKFVEISWKLFLVLLVLGGIALAVYYLAIKPSETTTTIGAIINASSFLALLI